MDMKGLDFLNKQDAVLCLIQALHKLFVFFLSAVNLPSYFVAVM